jgi:hypothetical protein
MSLERRDIERFFPDIVICMHKQSNDIKKLAYSLLLETYHANNQNALMPISLLQKVWICVLVILNGLGISNEGASQKGRCAESAH